MAGDPISAAKDAMSKADNFTKSVEGQSPSRFAVKAKPAAQAAPATAKPVSRGSQAADNIKAVADTAAGAGMKGVGTIGVMHKGGTVPGKKGEEVPMLLEAGEKVTPAADKGAAVGRNSEYRKVYIGRKSKTDAAKKQTRQGGGNTPVKGEKHDQKKA